MISRFIFVKYIEKFCKNYSQNILISLLCTIYNFIYVKQIFSTYTWNITKNWIYIQYIVNFI